MMKRSAVIGGALVALCFAGAAPAVAGSGGNSWCKAEKAPRIEVKTSTDQVTWDFTKSEKQLNNFKIDTKNPYGSSIITDVGGLMQGGIQLKETMRFNTLTHRGLNQICYWFDAVTVTLHIEPTIYIAREFPRNSCKHNAIKEHEMKHITVDREIVNKYATVIARSLKTELDRQTVYGPYRVSQSKEVEIYMKDRLESILRKHAKEMEDERRVRQQAVDSLAEYERVNRMCR
jgi:hypothetical protein